MHRTEKYSEHSSIIWAVLPNGWVFVYELGGSGFESSHLSIVSLRRSLQISLHKVSFISFETSSLPHFVIPRFNVLTDVIICVSSAFGSSKSKFWQFSVNDVILQCYYLPMYQTRKSDIDRQWNKIGGRFPNFAIFKLISK